jgi:hypothetical protein
VKLLEAVGRGNERVPADHAVPDCESDSVPSVPHILGIPLADQSVEIATRGEETCVLRDDPAGTIERALQLGQFDSVQATWNLLEQSATSTRAEAHAEGVGVIVKEALANGRLTARGNIPALIEAAQRSEMTPDALALACVMAQRWVDIVLSGATTVTQLRSNLRAGLLDPARAPIEQLDTLVQEPHVSTTAES